MSQWYLSKNGQALGPLEEAKVIALIESGDVNPMDLVYQAGATEWLPISQIATFAAHFKAQEDIAEPTPNDSSGEKEWVLLKRTSTEKGREYKQLGPFSQSQVMELVDTGKIKFTDFAWKKGLESWVKLAELEEFDEPLPSSPAVDMSLYEKGQASLDEVTAVDVEQKASMTELVNIETYDHEKTQVMSPSQKLADDSQEESDELTATEAGSSPINEEGFVTSSDYKEILDEESQSGISLWSLEPPSINKKSKKEAVASLDEESKVINLKEKAKPKAKKPAPAKPKKSKKPKRKAEKVPVGDLFGSLDSEVWHWAIAIGAVVLSCYFFYMSFQGEPRNVATEQSKYGQRAVQPQVDLQPTAALPPPAIEPIEVKPVEVVKRPPQVVQKKKLPESLKPKPLPVARKPEAPSRQIASPSKKQKIKEQAKRMSRSKKKKAIKKPSKKKTTRRKVAKSKAVAKPSGGAKAQSFYKQRDRKALFYSSLKAEILAVEIQENYRKLKSNKRAWMRYYGQWKKKVNNSLSREIRSFPKRNEQYAYPKVMADFKKDYGLFYKYGESFNAKVNGGRVPSGFPSDMKKMFSKYRTQAKSLGR